MKILSALTALLSLFPVSHSGFAQKPEYIHIAPEHIKISGSIFSGVEVVDTRFDTVYMGFVQKGAFNRRAPIKLTQLMTDEVKESVSKLIANATKENNTALINIRSFFLSEFTGAMSERGTFIFKAGCYLKRGESYKFMFSVDTTIVVKAMDVTKKLLRAADEQFGLFVKRAATFDVTKIADGQAYSFSDIQHIDEAEKKLIPVYNVDLPLKGLYAGFEDFKNNKPTETSFIKEANKRTGEPSFFEVKEDSTKGKEFPRKNYYAICDGSRLYISTEYGLYPVTKKNYDFYFTGKAKETANTAEVAAASFMFGILGGMLASIPDKATFEFKIDHATGKFLPIKKISD